MIIKLSRVAASNDYTHKKRYIRPSTKHILDSFYSLLEIIVLQARHYAAAFIDLLGQRVAFRGQNLLPMAQTEEGKQYNLT